MVVGTIENQCYMRLVGVGGGWYFRKTKLDEVGGGWWWLVPSKNKDT